MSEKPQVHHIYDDIEEHDNRLPNWWVGLLWATIVFSAGYWLYYEAFRIGPNQEAEYEAEIAQFKSKQPKKNGPLEDASLLALAKDEKVLEKGKADFATTCLACHGPEGGGLLGPNLTDGYWLHGGKPMQIRKTIAAGVLEKGMPAWEQSLGAERVNAITAFVISLKGKNVPGKPPQGELEE